MQYSPKLKKVMAQIKKILVENDVAGIVVIHSPGFSEFLVQIDTSYSCAKFEGDQLRVRAKLSDYGGDKAKWAQMTSDTCNMIHHLAIVPTNVGQSLQRLEHSLKQKIDIEHTGGGFSSHTEQNN
jgi:hypothetical protein